MTDRCLADVRCLSYDRREQLAGETDGRLPLCEADLLAGERAVPALVLDYRDLEQHIPPALGVWGDGQPSARDEHRAPLRMAVLALQEKICWVMTTWGDIVREREKVSGMALRRVSHPSAQPPTPLDGAAVQRAGVILGPRVRLLAEVPPTTLADYPDVDDEESFRLGVLTYADVPGWRGVLDLSRLHNRARYLLGLTAVAPEPIKGVPCKNVDCDVKDLYRDLFHDEVFCGTCGKRLSAAEYEAWTKLVHGHVKPKKGKAA